MSISKEMKSIEGVVLELLKLDAKYKDSDRILCCKIWSEKMGGLQPLKEMTAYDFLCEYSNSKSKLTNAESISRVRRRLQKEKVELRGKNYKEKHKEIDNVKEFLAHH